MLFSAAQWHFALQNGALTGAPVTGKGLYYRRSAALTADSATELQRGDVQPQFVNETRRKVLTHNAGTASDPNIPAASGLVGLGECGLDPSVTKVKVVPPFISIGSRAKLVRTNTGALYGGSAPHQPCQVESHAPRPGPNMLRPKIRDLQTVKIEIDSGEPLRMGSRLG